MNDVYPSCRNVTGVSDIMDVVRSQKEALLKEVAKYRVERNVA